MIDPEAVVIVGRTVKDYKLCRQSIEPGFVILRCRVCTAKVVISPEGAANLSKYSALDPMVMCNKCALATMPSHAVPMMTKNGAAQMECSEGAKKTLDLFLDKLKWPRSTS